MTSAQLVSVHWGLFLTAVFLLPQLLFRQLTWRGAVVTTYACMLFAVVFLPLTATGPSQPLQLVPFQWIADTMKDGPVAVQQTLLNVALFVPLGVLLAKQKRSHAVAIGFAVSLAVEVTQLTLGHRIFDVDDLITNTTGTLVGYLLVSALQRATAAQRPSSHTHRVPDRLRLQVGAQARHVGLPGEVLTGTNA